MSIQVTAQNSSICEGIKIQHINPTPFLCKSAVREFLLGQARRTRAHKYTRVSEQTLIEANEHLRQWMVLRIARLPSMGKMI